MERKDEVYVVGHKNPDTDSICAAVSYAYLKNAAGGNGRYVPIRAGQINEETEFALKYWGVEPPRYIPNVGLQISDLDIDDAEGAPDDITIRIAWEFMKESETETLPVIGEDGILAGLLTVGDIADYYIDAYTRTIMAEAKTKYFDIAETINGEVVVGDPEARFTEGEVIIAAARPERLSNYIKDRDLVITSDREDTQLAVIECGASCMAVTLVDEISDAVRAKAEEKGCVVICTKFDTYTVARLINQSIPVKHLMKSSGIISFHIEDFIDDVNAMMGKNRHRDFPIVDRAGHYLGMISRRDILNPHKKKLILVDHTEESQAVDNLNQAEILEIIDHHRIGTVETLTPVFFRGEPVGCTCTILFSMYREQGIDIPKEIAGLMCSAIVSDTLLFRSPTCTPRDERAGRELAAIAGIDIEKYAKEMFRAGSNLKGKSADEILHQDYKKFIFGETVFGVGQISSMDEDELSDIAETLRPQLELECGRGGTKMVFFMLTDILSEDTWLLSYGKGSDELVESSYGKKPDEGITVLNGVVSRKKQLIPAFMSALQA